jgi:hypothetical protein
MPSGAQLIYAGHTAIFGEALDTGPTVNGKPLAITP